MKKAGKLLLFAAVLCLLPACGPEDTVATEYLEFAKILPDEWEHIDTIPLDANDDDEEEWVVFYRFDMAEKQRQNGYPIAGVVYQPKDDRRPPCILPYKLRPWDRDYLCECKCQISIEDVLSEIKGEEVVVKDQCDGTVTRVSIFRWNQDLEPDGRYEPLGDFAGDRIDIKRDTLIADRCLPVRAQFGMRHTYRPDETTKSYYRQRFKSYIERQSSEAILVESDTHEFIFCQGEPNDVMDSPYPEKIILSFYHHYTDDKAADYFTEEAWQNVAECDADRCGCTVPRNKIKDVRVTYLDWGQESHEYEPDHQCGAYGPNQASAQGTVVCEHKDGNSNSASLTWRLACQEHQWKLEEIEMTNMDGQ